MRLGERVADLPEEVDDAPRRKRSEAADDLLEREAFEKLHHVIERAVVRASEVVELDGVRRPERGRRLRLALETRHHLAPRRVGAAAHELDRRVAREHAVLGAPHFAHAAVPEQSDEPVAPELPRAAGLLGQLAHDARAHDRGDGRDRRSAGTCSSRRARSGPGSRARRTPSARAGP